MYNFLYKKETFIYEKSNSITNDLCKDIIEIYNNDEKKKINQKYNIDENIEYKKLKTYLITDLNTHIFNYIKKINKIYNYNLININMNEIKIIDYSFFIDNNSSNNSSSNNITFINRFSIEKHGNIKKFMYIWFLNDYDGELIFWNEYKIIPKCGNFLLFPVSWCFPYQEIINFNTNKYIIYGYIYN
jgi:hypothetical protein